MEQQNGDGATAKPEFKPQFSYIDKKKEKKEEKGVPYEGVYSIPFFRPPGNHNCALTLATPTCR